MALRVASLLPSATEILFAVGAGDQVVGVTHECDFPPETHRLPALTSSAIDHEGRTCADIDRHIRSALHAGSSLYRLNERLLRDLHPDLIVTQELCDVCAVAYGQVEQAARRLPGEVPVLSLEPCTLDDVLATMLSVGRATGHDEEAAAAVEQLRERIGAVEALPPVGGGRPGVVCIEWTDPIMTGGHWVPEMVRRAGGRDLLGPETLPSTRRDWDEVLAARPEVMVLMPCGFGLEATLQRSTDVTARPGFDGLPCASTGRVAAVDGSSYFNRPGPRLVDGLELLAAILRAGPGAPLPAGASWVSPSSE